MAEVHPATEVPHAPSSIRATHVRYLVLVLLCSLACLTYLDRICIMRVQGDIERDLHLDRLSARDEQTLLAKDLANDTKARTKLSRDRAAERMSWVFSAFVLGYVLFGLPGGWLADRFRPRAIILLIVLWWSLFTALTGAVNALLHLVFSNPAPWLLLCAMVVVRFLFGLGEAGAYPNIARALGRWFPFRERGAAQGAIWLSSRFGGAIAPTIIGSLVVVAGGWQRAFWILGAAGIVWALLFFLWFSDRPEEKASANQAECELIRAPAAEQESIYEDEAPVQVPWPRLFFSPNLLWLYVASFTAAFSWFFYVTFLPKYLKEQFQVDYSDSEIMTGLPLLVGGLACLAGGRLSDVLIRATGSRRWGRSLQGAIGLGVAAVCALVVSRTNSPWPVILIICVASAFQDLALPAMWSASVDIGGRCAGTVGGCMNSAGAVGAMLSPLVAAKVAALWNWKAVFVVFAASYFLGAVAWLRVDASRPFLARKTPR
jgi:MFS transporter, ACS family, glucarate transporter